MNRCVRLIFSLMFIVLVLVNANNVYSVTIDSVTVDEQDLFYSNYVGNDILNLKVQISGITQGNTAIVTADFSNLGINVCQGNNTNNTILLTDSGNGLWTGQCNLGTTASINAFKIGQILIDARESNGGPTSPQGSITIGVYNTTIPRGNSCYRFTEGSTNFVEEDDFDSMDITLVVEAYGSSSCVSKGISWGNSWINVAKIRFLGVNLADASDASKISNLINIVKINYSAPKSNQNNKISIDTNELSILSTNTFIEFYRLPFLSQPTIVSDNTVPAQAVTWSNNGFDLGLNYSTFNVSFTVTPGFSGYTITDNAMPVVVVDSPTVNQNYNSTNQTITVTLNGTKTEISKALFYINGILVSSYVYDAGVNTANCISGINPEISVCTFNISKNDGNYNLSVTAYDFGLGSGNVGTTSILFVVQTSSPQIVVTSPVNGSTYKETAGSMLKLNFTVSDGNGISKCWYELDSNKIFLTSCNTSITSQLYLSSDSYNLNIYANDTLGRLSSKEMLFTVSDSTAPVLTDNSKVNSTLKKTTILSILTDENSTCKYDYSDISYNKMKYSFVNKILSHNATINTSNNESYTLYVRCEDMSENANDNSLKVVLGKALPVVPVVPATPTDITEIIDLGLLSAGSNIINIENSKIAITDILLTTLGIVDNVVVTIIVPLKSSTKYGGDVYQYIEIVHGAIKDSIISGAKIKFSVDKSWLEDKDVNASEISLFRYSNGKWTKIPTIVSKIGSNKVEYLAESPGLSVFAISTEEKIVPVVVVVANNLTNNTNNSVNANNMPSEEEKNATRKSSLWVILVAIIVFIILIIYILAEINYRKGPPSIFPKERTPVAKIKKLFN